MQTAISLSSLCPTQAEDANRELLDMLAEFLPKRFPDRFSRVNNLLINHSTKEEWDLSDPSLDPLEVSALLVQVSASVHSVGCLHSWLDSKHAIEQLLLVFSVACPLNALADCIVAAATLRGCAYTAQTALLIA